MTATFVARFKSAIVSVKVLILVPVLLFAGPRAAALQDQPDMQIDSEQRNEVIEKSIELLNRFYVFPDVARRMEQAVRERMARKEYDRITGARELSQTLTTHLQEVSRDRHLRVGYSHRPIPERERGRRPTPEEIERQRAGMRWENYGFEKVERLRGNIGYIELLGFFPPEIAGDTAAAAMNFLEATDALIIDLRSNGGGTPAMVAFLSTYLFEGPPVHLNDLYWREGDRTHQWWTFSYVPGKRHAGKDVFVLTSRRTFSAAEEFTYNLQNLKRATIVGETTGGGAHPGGTQRINQHFTIWVPSGRAINPISKTNWEGTGVKPDIEVPAAAALKTAQLEALKRLHAKAPDEDAKKRLERIMKTVEQEVSEPQSQ